MRLLVTAALLLVLGSRATPPPPPAPEQIHLALAGDDPATGQPTGMRIGWYSALSTPQHLQFGAAPGKLTHTPASPIVTRSYIPGFGFHHACLLDARVLVSSAAAAAALPDTVYYRVGSSVSGQQGAAISWSDTFSFSTRPFSFPLPTAQGMMVKP